MLDLTGVAHQVGSMVERLKAARAERQERLYKALETLRAQAEHTDELKRKIAASRTTWLVAKLTEGLWQHHAPSPLPPDFSIAATDGSQIEMDRHRAVRCYLINIGGVILTYGGAPDAALESSARLYFNDEDLVIPSPSLSEREQPIEGALLGLKRSVDECHRLTGLAARLPAGKPGVALLDGSLILWNLEAYPEFVCDALLHKSFLRCLDEMQRRRVPVASYISYPRSTDVLNVLRVALCPHEAADCDRYCAAGKRDCDAVAGVQDREIMSELLGTGERSALFISPSRIVERHYGAHRVYFFYLKADEEVGRVEIPEWVALDNEMMGLVHAVMLDQCRRGGGYPVALAEAHEQAVVTGADREGFWQLVEAELAGEHVYSPGSAKSLSKRTRWT